MNTKQKAQRNLKVTPDINMLFGKKPLEVTEEQLRSVLKKYNLRNALEILGRKSCDVFSLKNKDLGPLGYKDVETRVMVTQCALAYLANVFICSGANDSSEFSINVEDNVLGLLGIYQDRLVDTVDLKGADKINAFFIRLAFQQLIFQKSSVNTISRAIVMFRDIAPKIKASTIKSFEDVFKEQNGLSLKTYFELCLIIYAGAATGSSSFSESIFTNANLPQVQGILTEDNIKNMFNILSCDYETFKREDAKANQCLDPVFTKNKFNPLFVYPIIKDQSAVSGSNYLVPNIYAFLDKAYLGIFWWFHRYYEKRGEQRDFRTYFGEVFQAYVGIILKTVFGSDAVKPEFVYGKENIDFVDWYVEQENKVYLFEAKASQFALDSKLTGDAKTIKAKELRKITGPMAQLFKRVRDINRYEDLKRFRGKKIYPVTIVMDLPLVDTHLYQEWIQEELINVEKMNSDLQGLKDFECYFLNIEDLERYSGIEGRPDLENVFVALKGNHQANFYSKCLELASGKGRRCEFLDEVYKDLWAAIIGNPPPFVKNRQSLKGS